MSNYNYVCFDCHKARRVDPRAKSGPVLCTSCNNEMICIGIKLRIPQKADKKGWEELKNIITSSFKDNSLKRHRSRLRGTPREALINNIRETYGLKTKSALRKRRKLRDRLSKINDGAPNQ